MNGLKKPWFERLEEIPRPEQTLTTTESDPVKDDNSEIVIIVSPTFKEQLNHTHEIDGAADANL